MCLYFLFINSFLLVYGAKTKLKFQKYRLLLLQKEVGARTYMLGYLGLGAICALDLMTEPLSITNSIDSAMPLFF